MATSSKSERRRRAVGAKRASAYLFAVLLAWLAYVGRMQYPIARYDHFYIFYVLAVVVAAAVAGTGPAIVCSVLGAVAGTAEVHTRNALFHWIPYGVFISTLLLVCWLSFEIRRRRKTEMELLMNQEKLSQVLRAGNAWAWEWNAETDELVRSREATRVMPEIQVATFEEALAQMHPEDRERVREGARSAFKRQGSYADEFRYILPNGSVRWLSLQTAFFPATSSEPARMAGISIDITERKLAETQMARLAAIVRSSDDAIYSKSLEGIVLSWNLGAEKMYGYATNEIVGRPVTILSPPDRRDETPEILERLRRGETIQHFETERLAKDGHRMHVALTISPIRDRKGTIIAASTTARDISERMQAEEALRHADKLSAAGRMAATIAHEINNPLESVLNSLYLLEQQKLPGEAEPLAAIARREAVRIAHIVKQTLGFYRESAEPMNLRVTEILDDVLSLYDHKLKSSGISIIRKFEAPGALRGFPGELRQVFSNLIINASEAMSTGGRLTLHVYQSRDWRTGTPGVRVTVGDTGTGIARSARARLFEPFFTTKGERGTGLGLWVTTGLISKHGGHIQLHSSTRNGASGTCFSVFLPAYAFPKIRPRRAA